MKGDTQSEPPNCVMDSCQCHAASQCWTLLSKQRSKILRIVMRRHCCCQAQSVFGAPVKHC